MLGQILNSVEFKKVADLVIRAGKIASYTFTYHFVDELRYFINKNLAGFIKSLDNTSDLFWESKRLRVCKLEKKHAAKRQTLSTTLSKIIKEINKLRNWYYNQLGKNPLSTTGPINVNNPNVTAIIKNLSL
jgi:hypothetical protein